MPSPHGKENASISGLSECALLDILHHTVKKAANGHQNGHQIVVLG